jgi:uncharacterized Zn finger protein (UPF0148 family)
MRLKTEGKQTKKTICPNCEKRTLWQATLEFHGSRNRQKMPFRSSEDFDEASAEASRLLESSPAAEMSSAYIVEIQRVAHLWN